MSEPLRLHLELVAQGPAGAFVLSDEQVAELDADRRAFPVAVTVNGATLPLRLARMGGQNLIGFSKANRARAGVELGGEYDVEVAVDGAERSVEVPPDLAQALAAEPGLEAAFAALAPSQRKEFVRWVSEAKRETTRAGRVSGTVEMVREGRTR